MALNLARLRKERKISRGQLAKRSGVSKSYILEIEHNKYDNPGLKIICSICKVLKCTPNDLIPEELYKEDGDGNKNIHST